MSRVAGATLAALLVERARSVAALLPLALTLLVAAALPLAPRRPAVSRDR
jgi:hypothetical protein